MPGSPTRRRVLAGTAALAAWARTGGPRMLALAASPGVVGVASPAAAQLAAGAAPGSTPANGAGLTDFLTHGRPVRVGRIKLDLPVLAENGNSVPMTVSVDSPMTERDYVRVIHLVSERNPVRLMASFFLGPYSGQAQIVSRVRLAGSQRVFALAEMSDETLWIGSADVVVTLSACIDES